MMDREHWQVWSDQDARRDINSPPVEKQEKYTDKELLEQIRQANAALDMFMAVGCVCTIVLVVTAVCLMKAW